MKLSVFETACLKLCMRLAQNLLKSAKMCLEIKAVKTARAMNTRNEDILMHSRMSNSIPQDLFQSHQS